MFTYYLIQYKRLVIKYPNTSQKKYVNTKGISLPAREIYKNSIFMNSPRFPLIEVCNLEESNQKHWLCYVFLLIKIQTDKHTSVKYNNNNTLNYFKVKTN